jgi:hypothetical protein
MSDIPQQAKQLYEMFSHFLPTLLGGALLVRIMAT